MLPQVVKTREASGAMALEGSFTRMFTNVPCQMFAPGEAQVAGREVCAEEALSLLLLGRPV